MLKIMNYSKQGLWSLFLACAFPIHVWAILLIFNDVEWVAKRSNMSAAVGVAAYGLLFALFESVIFFVFAALLGLLISPKWGERRRIALMIGLSWILTGWAIVAQIYAFINTPFPEWLGMLIFSTGRPLIALSLITFFLAGTSVVFLTWITLRYEKPALRIMQVMEKISLLSILYLFFDFAGLVVLVFRNL